MRKIKIKIIWVFTLMFLIAWIVYAADSYRLNHDSELDVDKYYTCLENDNSLNDYFIPTKTDWEWDSFKNHYPNWVSKIDCNPEWKAFEQDWSIRMKDLDRTGSYPDCWDIPEYFLTVYLDEDNSYEKRYDNYDDANAVTEVVINWVTVKKAQWEWHTGQCSTDWTEARKSRRIKY